MYQTEDQKIEMGIICLRSQIEAIELLIWEIEADLKIQKEIEDMHNTHKKNRR